MPAFERATHMALTVRDVRVGAGWCERVLGLDFVRESGSHLVLPESPGSSCSILSAGSCSAWCNHAGRSGDAFDPLRTGLDHVAFEVADRAEPESRTVLSINSASAISRCATWAALPWCRWETPTGSGRAVADDHATSACREPLMAAAADIGPPSAPHLR